MKTQCVCVDNFIFFEKFFSKLLGHAVAFSIHEFSPADFSIEEVKKLNDWKELPTIWKAQDPAESASSERKKEWLLGRNALEQVLLDLLNSGNKKENIFLSLAHTSDRVVAVGVTGAGIFGVGVDVESKSRFLPAPVVERVMGDSEKEILHKLPPLQAWVAKESSFKAASRALGVSLLTEVELIFWDSAAGIGVARAKNAEIRFGIVDMGDWWLGIAVL